VPSCEQVLVYNGGSVQGEGKGASLDGEARRSASSSLRSNCSLSSEWPRCTGAIRMSVPEFVWNPAPAMLLLGGDEVHVWRAALDLPISHVASFEQTLAADERRRAGLFHFERDRSRFIVARGFLRAILGRYLHRDPRTLRFCSNPYGKPSLTQESGGEATLSFNVTHAGALALYAVTRKRAIGIDLEDIRMDVEWESIAERFFSPHERRMLRALPSAQRLEAFFRCWTHKEAYIKARGMGLSLALDQFDVSVSPGVPPALLQTREEGQESSRWSLHDLPVGEGLVAALAVEEDPQLLFWESSDLIP
jgi:4'-phosphopantetheinyl transferase